MAVPGVKVTEIEANEERAAGVAIETVFVSALVVLIVQSDTPEALDEPQLTVLAVPETVRVGVVPEMKLPKVSLSTIRTVLVAVLFAMALSETSVNVEFVALAPAGDTTVAVVLQAVVKLPELALINMLSAFS